MTTLVWLRDDLRTIDHGALSAACAESHDQGVVALWIREDVRPAEDGQWLGGRPLGGATRWWYHRSLSRLGERLAELGVPLVFAAGDPRTLVPKIASTIGARTVRWSRRYAPRARDLDTQVKEALRGAGVDAHSHPGALLIEPWKLATRSGHPYTVFTPFHTAAQQLPVGAVLPTPGAVSCPAALHDRLARGSSQGLLLELADLGLVAGHDWWDETVAQHWEPGEVFAHQRLDDISDWLRGYRSRHNLPADPDSTSRLSPHLRAGELSPRMVLHAARRPDLPPADAASWVRQLFWREFSWHLTYHFPDMHRVPLRPQFTNFPYQPDEELAQAWRRGRTGIDLVDAGMLQLWHTGWIHNRVRMVTASLFTKNLLQPWRDGEQWFWDTLVDADEANNPVSWQWVAGCGADAAPYFRVFNPDLQRERFDPQGVYIDRWLSRRGPALVPPIVDLASSRREALSAHDTIRTARSASAEDVLPE